MVQLIQQGLRGLKKNHLQAFSTNSVFYPFLGGVSYTATRHLSSEPTKLENGENGPGQKNNAEKKKAPIHICYLGLFKNYICIPRCSSIKNLSSK